MTRQLGDEVVRAVAVAGVTGDAWLAQVERAAAAVENPAPAIQPGQRAGRSFPPLSAVGPDRALTVGACPAGPQARNAGRVR